VEEEEDRAELKARKEEDIDALDVINYFLTII
jgi:hypothetical protein